ncbi:VOC family protein [Silvibacterium sp.]|uniref:VOC family protein n=1 Tax=Silvibacterium sp. TaxID=1964179 RepID=UPI0039E6CE24
MPHCSRAFCGFLSLSILALSAHAQAPAVENPLHLTPHHVTASVADIEKEASWYENVLGLHRGKMEPDTPDFKRYGMTMPGLRIDLVWRKGSVRHKTLSGNLEQGWLHVVFTSPDLNAAYKYLKAKGTDVQPDYDAHGRVNHLSLHDPEGNEIGIAND